MAAMNEGGGFMRSATERHDPVGRTEDKQLPDFLLVALPLSAVFCTNITFTVSSQLSEARDTKHSPGIKKRMPQPSMVLKN